jgi:uncharacterized membrane protein
MDTEPPLKNEKLNHSQPQRTLLYPIILSLIIACPLSLIVEEIDRYTHTTPSRGLDMSTRILIALLVASVVAFIQAIVARVHWKGTQSNKFVVVAGFLAFLFFLVGYILFELLTMG